MIFRRLASTGALAAFAIGSASAQVAYSNFGPSYGYNEDIGYDVAGPSSNIGTYSTALQFTPTLSGTLDHIVVPLANVSGDNGYYGFSLLADNGGTPGAALYTSAYIGFPLAQFGTPDLTTVNFYNMVSITAGTTYWMEGFTDGNNWDVWNFSPNTGSVSQSTGSGPGTQFINTAPALEVDVQAVPEPTTFAALGLGVLALRRRRKA